MESFFLGLIVTAAVACLVAGCGKVGVEDALDESISAMSSAAIAGVANATETNGSFTAFNEPRSQGRMLLEGVRDLLNPLPQSAWADNECRGMRRLSCDENGLIVIELDSCKRGRAVWTGSESLQFSSLAVCQARTGSRGVPVSGSVLRTFGGTIDESPTSRTMGDRVMLFDTTTPYGYETPVSGGSQVEFGLEGDSPLRTISIKGIRHVAKKVGKDEVKFDHSVSSDPASPLKISGAGGAKEISQGVVSVQHNLAKYTGKATIKEKLTFTDDCCHPVAGKIETVYSGSKTGSESMAFTAVCGVATLTAADGSTASVQLRHCF